MLAEALLAHLVGDYLLQTEWMATQKTRRWWPAIVHGIVYSLPFLLITQSPWALLVISGTHMALDRFRVARYVIWAKNLVGPREYRASLKESLANCGFAAGVPSGLATALLIVSDNTIHMLFNAAALAWLR
jgi:Protein of unknown function (DUF3307)